MTLSKADQILLRVALLLLCLLLAAKAVQTIKSTCFPQERTRPSW